MAVLRGWICDKDDLEYKSQSEKARVFTETDAEWLQTPVYGACRLTEEKMPIPAAVEVRNFQNKCILKMYTNMT
jgi:hypothetical protein